MTVELGIPTTGYRHRASENTLKTSRMTSTRGRAPLQFRKASSTVVSASSSSSEEYCSTGNSAASKRFWSAEDSSHNENNKRISSFAKGAVLRNSNDAIDTPNSSTVAQTGAKTFGHQGRSISAAQFKTSRSSKPHLSRASSEPMALSKATRSGSDEETVVIEEKRRKLNGDGYTFHRYLRGRLLGKGGFAKVYHCTALETKKTYAVKIVPKANLVKPRAKQKLQAEIKIHRTLKHRNICEYKHFFEDKTNCYILLELCHNQSMNELIKRRKRLTEPEAAYYMKQLIEAVRYMHGQRVIHRDLKLGNLFLDKNLLIKVGDLGLATRLQSAEEKRKTICGTPNYIAPEVIQGSKETRGHSFEVDIWSMGVILFTILIGKPPYEAKDVKATYQRIIANQYSFPNNVGISNSVRDLITSMLQSKPDMRPTLDEIEVHSFFTSNGFAVPDSLPSNATHVAPQWREDDFGNLFAANVAEDENVARASKKKTQSSFPHGLARRQPFASKDPNVGIAPSKSNKPYQSRKDIGETGDAPLNLRSALVASSVSKPPSTPGFKIFDESESSSQHETKKPHHTKPPQSRSSKKREDGLEELTSKTSALSLNSKSGEPIRLGKDTPSPQCLGAKQRSTVDTDAKILHAILANVSDVLERAETVTPSMLKGALVRSVSHGGPTQWVTRYVDYTSKYGLGFLMNDGSSGVYFNDSTKAVLEAEGERFQYVERKKLQTDSNDGGSVRRSEPSCDTYTLSSYPDNLQKKVTLLKHFRNYLIEQQKHAEDDGGVNVNNTVMATDEPIYLKKWVRTKHAILFRLSNQTIQIVFYDQTEVLLTPDEDYITYVDKKGSRSMYHFSDELVSSNAELAKRLKYSKEILTQLVAGQRR